MEKSPNSSGCASKFMIGTFGCTMLTVFAIPFLCFVALIIFAIIGGSELSQGYITEEIDAGSSSEQIAVISIDGVIMDVEDGLHQNTIMEYVLESLDNAIADSNIKAVILRLDTPGGSVYDSARISEKIAELQSQGKLVVAVVESMAASGGYWVAAGCDYIFIQKESMTGSIGVLLQTLEYDELFNKIGLEEVIITNTNGVNKVPTDLNNPDNPQHKLFKDLLDENFEQFLSIIMNGRGLTRDEVLKYADGRLISGEKAVDISFADEIGGQEDAIAYIASALDLEDPQVVEYQWIELVGWSGFTAKANKILMINDTLGQSGGSVLAMPEFYFGN